jgi:hypothetical protein
MTDQPSQPSAVGPTRESEISLDDGQIIVSNLRTKRGRRAEIAAGGESVRLDAMILESIAWQRSRSSLATVAADTTAVEDDEVPLTGGERVSESAGFQITNEYAQVELAKVQTGAGEAVQVSAPARGSETNLGAPTLRALARITDTFAFSTFFETPVGPEDTPIEGPH